MAWQSTLNYPKKQKRRTSEEVYAQNKKNNDLAAEYKTASPWRRAEIFEEYYEGNQYWIRSWPRWDAEHWNELTQIFVSYWHEAFMRYSPTTERSVFNFFMDRLYKSSASQEYRRWINKEARNTDFEFDREDGSEKRQEGKVRKEFFVHPQSDFDRAILRSKLCRNLDSREIDIVEKHFFGNEKIVDLMKDQFGAENQEFTVKQISQAAYNFKKKHYDALLDKLYLNVSRDELLELASQNDSDHPPKLETIYNTKGRHKKWGPTEGRRKPSAQLAEAA